MKAEKREVGEYVEIKGELRETCVSSLGCFIVVDNVGKGINKNMITIMRT